MSGINKVMLVGHLGKDPELRYLDEQVAVLSFPLATSEIFIKNGVSSEQTEWHNIVMWRGLAECSAKVLRKGKLVFLDGKIRTRSFEDKAGLKKYITEVIVENFRLLGRRSDFEEDPSGNNEETFAKTNRP